jgi:hypothetical protein
VEDGGGLGVEWRVPFNVVAAHVACFVAEGFFGRRCHVSGATLVYLVETVAGHVEGKFHVIVDGLVYGDDAVGVVYHEFGIVWGLDGVVHDAVSRSMSVLATFGSKWEFKGCTPRVSKSK